MLFNPEDFYSLHKPLSQAQYRLAPEALEAKAMDVLRIRQMFMARGVDLDQQAVAKDARDGRDRRSNLVMLNRRYTRKSKYVPKVPSEDPCDKRNTGAHWATRS